jgi:hypothetical protein
VSVALVIQHEKRMRRIIWSAVVYLAVAYFYTLNYKRYDFRVKLNEFKVRVWISFTTFV